MQLRRQDLDLTLSADRATNQSFAPDDTEMTTAGKLLKIYQLRMAMQEDGTTKPSEVGRKLTRLLVEKLSQLDSTDEIEIESDDHLAKFIRAATGETIAEIALDGIELND
jgi:hypothetical protein